MFDPPPFMRTTSRPPFPLKTPAGRPPVRLLLVITLAVLLGHWAVLTGAPLSLSLHSTSDAPPALRFITRTVAAPASVQSAAAPVRPRSQRVATPSPRKPTAAEPPTHAMAATAVDAENAPPATDSAAADPSPDLLAGADPTSPNPAADTAPTSPPVAAPPQFRYPAPVRLKYEVRGKERGFPFFANGELLWQHDGASYDARLQISIFLLGSRVQTSTGQLTPLGLEPKRFGDKVRSEVAAHFERSKGKVIFSANTPEVPLQAGTQDNLSAWVQLASTFAGTSGQVPDGTQLVFLSVGPRSAETWTFTVGALEKITLPGGEVSAVHLVRTSSNAYDGRADVWLAPGMDYMPVRILVTWGEDHFADQQWSATEKP